jgi:hypothetical protein
MAAMALCTASVSGSRNDSRGKAAATLAYRPAEMSTNSPRPSVRSSYG